MASIRDATVKNQLQSRAKEELPPLPKLGGMIFAREPKPKKPPPPPVKTEVLRFGAGSRTKGLTGKGLINKARREAREAALFKPGGRGNLSTPSHMLNSLATPITKPPASLVPQPRNPALQRPTPPVVNMSTPVVAAPRPHHPPLKAPAPSMLSTEERERRLKALTKPRNAAPEDETSPPLLSSFSHPAITSQTLASPLPSPVRAPPTYHVPRRLSPDSKTQQPPTRKRAPVDPFIPAKRRRIA